MPPGTPFLEDGDALDFEYPALRRFDHLHVPEDLVVVGGDKNLAELLVGGDLAR